MKNISIIILITGIFLFSQCGKKQDDSIKAVSFNQSVPANQAELFLKEVIATGMNERDAALSPDGKTFYFTVQFIRNINAIAYTEYKNGKWNKPQLAPFSGEYSDLEPVFHPDGKRLFFVSNRPFNANGEPKDYDIWYIEHTEKGWGKPVNPGSPLNTSANEFYPSFTEEGTIFFCAERENSIGGEDIFYSEYKEGRYKTPQNPGNSINSKYAEYNAHVSPDGSYIMYNTHRKGLQGGDISIAFKNKKGEWTKPINMGKKINSDFFEFCPSLSPDGKHLFFTSQRMKPAMKTKDYNYNDLNKWHNKPQNGNGDIYRINAQVIEELKRIKFGETF